MRAELDYRSDGGRDGKMNKSVSEWCGNQKICSITHPKCSAFQQCLTSHWNCHDECEINWIVRRNHLWRVDDENQIYLNVLRFQLYLHCGTLLGHFYKRNHKTRLKILKMTEIERNSIVNVRVTQHFLCVITVFTGRELNDSIPASRFFFEWQMALRNNSTIKFKIPRSLDSSPA